MSMPEPRKGEPRRDYVNRCVRDPKAMKAEPDGARRFSSCQAAYRKAVLSGRSMFHLTGLVKFEAEDGSAAEPESDVRPVALEAYTGKAMPFWGIGLVIDLKGMALPSQRIPLLLNHNAGQAAGSSDRIRKTRDDLTVFGSITGKCPAGRQIIDLADDVAFPWQASVGIDIDEFEEIAEGKTVKVNGRSLEGPLLVARATTLREVSFVPMGRDDETSSVVLSSAGSCSCTNPQPGSETMTEENRSEQEIREEERSRYRSLKAFFGSDPAFAEKAYEAGYTMSQAKEAYADVALATIKELKEQHSAELSALRAELEESKRATAAAEQRVQVLMGRGHGGVDFNAKERENPSAGENLENLPLELRAEREWEKNGRALKEEGFSSLEHYKAWLKASSNGQIRRAATSKGGE